MALTSLTPQVAVTSQTHREFSGRGQLLRDNCRPVAVRYYLVLSARLANANVTAGPYETQWEWDKAQGFLTLLDETDAFEVDIRNKYALVLDDGTRCVPTLCHDYNRPLLKYRVQCSPRDLLNRTLSTVANSRPVALSAYDAPL